MKKIVNKPKAALIKSIFNLRVLNKDVVKYFLVIKYNEKPKAISIIIANTIK